MGELNSPWRAGALSQAAGAIKDYRWRGTIRCPGGGHPPLGAAITRATLESEPAQCEPPLPECALVLPFLPTQGNRRGGHSDGRSPHSP